MTCTLDVFQVFNEGGVAVWSSLSSTLHILTAVQLWGWEESFVSDERQSRGEKGRRRLGPRLSKKRESHWTSSKLLKLSETEGHLSEMQFPTW